MNKIMKLLGALILTHFLFVSSVSYGDETDLFSAGKTDALILLDLSGSMNWDVTGTITSCVAPSCTSRLAIAKEAIRTLLDADGNGTIDTQDEERLGIRFGYMRFYDCASDDTGLNYNAGCVSLRKGIGSSYSDINTAVQNENASGKTPLASALNEARLYLNDHKAADPYRDCTQKFAILITDGADTCACGWLGEDVETDAYKRRKATVAQAKALADAGYRIFVVGFGANMPLPLKNTLNWAAYFGGTDNPNEGNLGNTSAITPSSNPCEVQEPPTNDPGIAILSGYAFLTSNPSELIEALKQAMTIVSEARYSFSSASVSATRTTSENHIFAPSFAPRSNDPFWRGHLKRYTINSDGTIPTIEDWDAGTLLSSRPAGTRNMHTYKNMAVRAFNTTVINPSDLDLGSSDTSGRDAIVGFVRGEPTYNAENWKLGDPFHSNPVTIGKPSDFFNDSRSPSAFSTFRANNQNRQRLVILGANDGQLHAFQASNGEEKWSFIPPNLLPKLKLIAHSSHPTSLSHQYFVDGPVTAADVWLGSGDGTNKSASDWKTLLVVGEGRGVLNPSNSPEYLWSASPSCDSYFFRRYTLVSPYYCGYYAFDITNTSSLSPTLSWRLNFNNASQARHMAEPWSKIAIGKVKISGGEKWVGFLGGGLDTQACQDADDSNCTAPLIRRGKGFFIVDLSNGNVIWSYIHDDNRDMDYTFPASPAIVDLDNDGFIDTVYLGDLGGNMWRFTLCSAQDGNSCGTASWTGGRLFRASTSSIQRPIFTTPAVAADAASQIWIFWGTGDKLNPSTQSGQDRFMGIIDSDRTSTYTIDNLQNITTGTYTGQRQGWYMNLTGTGEKVLADSTVFGGIVLFTTYTPPSTAGQCGGAGTARLYALSMMPLSIGGLIYAAGAGVLTEPANPASTAGGERSIVLGTGIPTAVVISQRPVVSGSSTPPPATDLFVTVSGGAGVSTSIMSVAQFADSPLLQRLRSTPPRGQILHWKDRRLQ
jgi:Tfp pilus tip-associated adhesin PilY1